MQLTFKVAQLQYTIEFTADNAPYKHLIPSHGRFLEREADVAESLFQVTVGEGLVEATLEGLEQIGEFDCGNCIHKVARLPEGGYRMLIHNVDESLAAAFESNARFTRCRILPFGTLVNQRFGIDNSIMIAYAFCMAHHGALLMHSSVPVKDGRGYLFQGSSGTGKSTHCRMWLENIPDVERINDDNPVVRIMPSGEVWVFGTPWSGSTPCYKNVGCPVGGFLRLHQAPHNKIRRMSKLEGFASVLSSCSTMIWDKPSYGAICDTISHIAQRVGCFDLECLPDRDAALLSYTTMSQAAAET